MLGGNMIELANIIKINNPNWHGKAEVYYYYAELEVDSESSDDNFDVVYGYYKKRSDKKTFENIQKTIIIRRGYRRGYFWSKFILVDKESKVVHYVFYLYDDYYIGGQLFIYNKYVNGQLTQECCFAGRYISAPGPAHDLDSFVKISTTDFSTFFDEIFSYFVRDIQKSIKHNIRYHPETIQYINNFDEYDC
jgi:hypothetical protein